MRPRVATFDCYGTLVDWEGGIGAFLYALLLREGVEDPPPGRELRERWEAIQFQLVQGPYRPYKEILGEATLAWCREFGVPDRDIISHTLRQIEVPFDQVVVAEDVGAYKPAVANFERVLAEVGEDPADVLHVAFGFKYDIGPAKLVGMRTAWVNRHQEPLPDPDTVPDHEWRDLWGLAELASS